MIGEKQSMFREFLPSEYMNDNMEKEIKTTKRVAEIKLKTPKGQGVVLAIHPKFCTIQIKYTTSYVSIMKMNFSPIDSKH